MPPNEQVIFQGAIYDRKSLEKYNFPVGCTFNYSNASYNDIFTVVSIRKDPGAEFRQIVGRIAGEVWMLLSNLQKEAAAGAISFVVKMPPAEQSIPVLSEPAPAAKAKVRKKVKKTAKKNVTKKLSKKVSKKKAKARSRR